MEKDKIGSRLLVLDGLRGFAIILVFLNHITTTYINNYIPFNLLGWLIGDGVTGVTFLFILSGFLMTTIYPYPSNSLEFLQKRYTRIFPLFIVMSFVMLLYRLYPNMPVLYYFVLIAFFAVIIHLFWLKGIKPRSEKLKKYIFVSFLLLQLVVGLFYSFWVMRHPPIVFNQMIPAYLREAVIYLVNITLTLPLGDYVPMLDGVYWSLVAEVLFYVSYPTLIVPLVHILKKQSTKVKWLFFFSLILGICGATILSHRILVTSMLQPALWIYFVTGIILAFIFKHRENIFQRCTHLFTTIPLIFSVVIFCALLYSQHLCEIYLPDSFGPWIRIGYAVPLTYFVAVLLNQKTKLHQFFTMKGWVFLGTISYSIYLSHALIIHLSDQIFTPTNFFQNIFFIIGTLLVEVVVAYLLFLLLEKPYFLRSKLNHKLAQEKKVTIAFRQRILLGGIVVTYLVAIIIAYQSQFNFFSVSFPVKLENIIPSERLVSLKANPVVQVAFTGHADNLGIIAAKFSHSKIDHPSDQTLVFTLKQVGIEKPIAVTSYTLDYFNSKTLFPFGFPTITHSLAKDYIATFALSDKNSSDFVTVDATTFQVVYPADKKNILSHPNSFFEFLLGKIRSIVASSEATAVFILGLPISLICMNILRRK